MELLYAKLHDKYEKLKARKISEIDESFKDQELKFMNYIRLADELIKGLRSENESLMGEVRSIRSSCADYQWLLTEEREKTKELSKEVDRLQVLQQERDISSMEEHIDNTGKRKQNTEIVQFGSPGDTGVSLKGAITLSRRRSPRFQLGVAQPPEAFSEINSHGGPLSDDDQDHQQPNCTVENPVTAGECRSSDFMLVTLMESLTSMKISIANEAEKTFLSAVHQASGYSFRLSFLNEAEKTELLYEVVSMGTIGRVALEWMKEDVIFGLDMFPTFMNRLSRVLLLQ